MVFLSLCCSFFLCFPYIFLHFHFSVENSISGLFKEFLTVVMTRKDISKISYAETIILFHF